MVIAHPGDRPVLAWASQRIFAAAKASNVRYPGADVADLNPAIHDTPRLLWTVPQPPLRKLFVSTMLAASPDALGRYEDVKFLQISSLGSISIA